MLIDLQFLREVYQLQEMGKRVLKRLWETLKTKKLKRNQYLFKEGEESKYVYIIKEG